MLASEYGRVGTVGHHLTEVNTTNIKQIYVLRKAGSLYHVTRGKSRPASSKVSLPIVQSWKGLKEGEDSDDVVGRMGEGDVEWVVDGQGFIEAGAFLSRHSHRRSNSPRGMGG